MGLYLQTFIFTTCLSGILGNFLKPEETNSFGVGRFIPLFSSTEPANMSMTTTDMTNQIVQSFPVMKLGILSSIVTFLSPLLQGFLITSLILFALTGTASIICQMIDCSTALGFNNNFHSGHILPPLTTFHHHRLNQNDNQNPTLNTFPRRRNIQRRPWLPEPMTLTHDLDLEETVEKFGEH